MLLLWGYHESLRDERLEFILNGKNISKERGRDLDFTMFSVYINNM